MYDTKVNKLIEKNQNMLVPWYLLASYAYYVLDSPLISDECYDNIVKMILKKWIFIDHYHKHFLDYDSLKAGTFLGAYPTIVIDTATGLSNESN